MKLYPCPVCTTGYITITQNGLTRKLKCAACNGEAKMTEIEIREWLGQSADRYLEKYVTDNNVGEIRGE